MKTIKIENGEIRLGYEVNDLDEDTKEKVISEHREFLESNPVECEYEDGNTIFEYAEYSDEDVKENIEINSYLFDEYGEILPITTYTGKHPLSSKHSFGKRNLMCEIS